MPIAGECGLITSVSYKMLKLPSSQVWEDLSGDFQCIQEYVQVFYVSNILCAILSIAYVQGIQILTNLFV